MWKILGLVLFGTLVNVSEGKKVGIVSTFSFEDFGATWLNQLKLDGLLQNQLIALVDIQFPGLLGLFQITGLNIADVEITAYKSNYVAGLRGAEVVSGIRLSIGGSVLAGISSLIKISVNVQYGVKYDAVDFQAGSFRVIFQECNILFGDITIQILSVNLTPKALSTIKNSIIGNINLQICNFLAVAFNVVSARLQDTINVVIPFEPFGSLRCQVASLPDIRNSLLWLHLFVDFNIRGQGLLSIPDSAPDLILPPLEKYHHCQCLHAAVLDIFFAVVLRIQPQEFSCMPNVPPPSISSAILYSRISLLQSPVLQLGNGFAIVQVTVQMEFFFKNPDGSTTSIVLLQESLSLSATFTVTNGYLYASLSISGHKVVLISSAFGIKEVSSLEPHCGKLLGETFLVSLNGFLSVGIHLPSILTVILDKVSIQFVEHGLLLCI